MKTEKLKLVARVFQEPDGYWHFCDGALGYLDARNVKFPTRLEARRAAASAGYTHDRDGRLPKPRYEQW